MEEILDDLEDIEKDLKKYEKKADDLVEDGVDVEALLYGGEEDDLLNQMEDLASEEGDALQFEFSDEDFDMFKNDVKETAEGIDAQIENKKAAEEAQAAEEKKKNQELAETIRDAKLWTTWDEGTAGGDYDSTPDKERVYWSGNASKNDDSIWDYYKSDQEWTHKTFDAMAQAAQSGNWDQFIGFLSSIPESKVDNVGTIMYVVFNNHYEGFLGKLPAKVLKALIENTARGSIGSKQDVYYLVRDEGKKDGIKGNGEIRYGNHHIGFGVDTAVLGYGEIYRVNEEKERNEAADENEDYPEYE
ncbi:MAG: hypothetical protein R3351_05205 [Nitrospirales bacterium]|nr:hypothetical protein [Nitrospirales bacterium]